MDTQISEKVDISRILIQAADGQGSTARVTSMEAANSVLQTWLRNQLQSRAKSKTKTGAPAAECEVEILFEDGLRYRGHYRLTDQEKSVSLGRHVRRQLTAMSKGRQMKRDQHLANEPVIYPGNVDTAERAKDLLEHYNI